MADERYPPRLTEQPPSRTRFYKDKRNGKIFGICAGIADYTGFDVNLVRVCMVAAVFLSSGSILPFYFIAAFITPDKPRSLAVADHEEKQFWQGVRASPARSARERSTYSVDKPSCTAAGAAKSSFKPGSVGTS